MGRIAQWFGFGQSTPSQARRYGTESTTRALATPFSGGAELAPAINVAEDVFGASLAPVTRGEAMSVPAVQRGRHLICDVLARQPIKAYGSDGVPLAAQPRFLSWSRYFPPRLRMMWTLDDVLFGGWSLWLLDRGAPDSSDRREILDALRIAPSRWRQSGGQILIRSADGKTETPVPDGGYLLIPGPSEGLTVTAARTIRGARALEDQWLARVRNPTPTMEIRYTGEDDLTKAEMQKIRSQYLANRADEEGTVTVTPKGFELHPHGDAAPDLFVQGRNAVGLDIARCLNLPAAMLDVSQVNGSSVDYENADAARSGYADITLRSWALPIEEALSQDDVLPRGQYAQFDLSALLLGETGTGPTLED